MRKQEQLGQTSLLRSLMRTRGEILNYGKSWMGIFIQKGDQAVTGSQSYVMEKELEVGQMLPVPRRQH